MTMTSLVADSKPTPSSTPVPATAETLPESLCALAARYPGRERQVRELYALCGNPSEYCPPTMFVNGMTSTGKSCIVRGFFQALARDPNATPLPYAYVSCAEVQHAPRLLLERILRQLAGEPPELALASSLADVERDAAYVEQFGPSVLDGVRSELTMAAFLPLLRTVCRKAAPCGLGDLQLHSNNHRQQPVQNADAQPEEEWYLAPPNHTRYIVLDQAELLRDMSDTLLPAFVRLGELAQCKITVLLVSHLVWEKFRVGTGMYEPLIVRFPEYNKKEILAILLKCMPSFQEFLRLRVQENSLHAVHPDLNETSFRHLYIRFSDQLFESVQGAFHFLSEIRYVIDMLFPKFIAPVLDGSCGPAELGKLMAHIQPYLKGMLNKVYLRNISSAELDETHTAMSMEQKTLKKRALDLPMYTKYLLIAAFLASYNAAKFDQRFFSKYVDASATSKKRKGGKRTLLGGSSLRAQSQLLLGPKPFPVDRMLAIFYNIIDEEVDSSIDIYLQIASLITTGLLRCSGTVEKSLDGGLKCKCNVSYADIVDVAKSIRFEISRFLQDTNC